MTLRQTPRRPRTGTDAAIDERPPGHAARSPARQRILDSAIALVSEGGYDALQVRAITDRADVSSRTIYSYFDSLESLLIVAIAEQSAPLYERFTQSRPRNRTPAGRVNRLISDFTDIMTTNRSVTLALLRALVSGKEDVLPHVRAFARVLEDMLVAAMAGADPTANDREIAEILQNVWFSALVGWAAGTVSDKHVKTVMQSATRRLLARP
jgi:AcrR family transcriptional regulator